MCIKYKYFYILGAKSLLSLIISSLQKWMGKYYGISVYIYICMDHLSRKKPYKK